MSGTFLDSRLVAAALAVSVVLTLASCQRGSSPCQAAPDCKVGHECLAFRCVPGAGEPVPPSTRRWVALPTALGSEGHAEIAPDVDLGPTGGALYLDFELPKARCTDLESAFLLLDPADPGPSLNDAVSLSIRRVTSKWTNQDLIDVPPGDHLPEARGLIASKLTARVDVTELVCTDLDLKSSRQGLVVRSDAQTPLRIATGLSGQSPPRLELYLVVPKQAQTTEN